MAELTYPRPSCVIASGYLGLIGNATIGGRGLFDSPTMRTYTVLEIGEHQFKVVRASGLLDNYLSKGLGEEVTLELQQAGSGVFTEKNVFILMCFLVIFMFVTDGLFAGIFFSVFFAIILLILRFFNNIFQKKFEKNGGSKGLNLVAITIDGKRYTD